MILKMLLENFKADYDLTRDCACARHAYRNALAAQIVFSSASIIISAKGWSFYCIYCEGQETHQSSRLMAYRLHVLERTKLSKEILNLINDAYSEHIRILSKIPVSAKVGEASFRYKSVIEYDPKSKVALA